MMKKLYVFPLLCLNIVSFGQIPNLPTIQAPTQSSLGNYSNQNYGSPMNGRSTQSYSPSMPNSYQRNSGMAQQYNNYEADARSSNDAMMREIDRDIAEAQEMQFRQWVEDGRKMSFDLPSLS